MLNVVTKTTVPEESGLRPLVASANFCDAQVAILNYAELSPTEIFLRAASVTPTWINNLVAIRNRAAGLFGIKDVGDLKLSSVNPAAIYMVGDRISIFDIVEKTDSELILGIDDVHLDVRVSIFKFHTPALPNHYVVSTVVKVHNWLGHAYMVPVRPIHPLVVRMVMRRAPV